ncbi:hypothetical protein ASC66_11600 [Leifsonia sp. Root4]|nr:hypothetical protein ASC66_11600 [Leifsonia sp. Root4]
MSNPDPMPANTDRADEIVNPEDLPAQIEVTEHDGVTRIDIAADATVRPGDPSAPRGPEEDSGSS